MTLNLATVLFCAMSVAMPLVAVCAQETRAEAVKSDPALEAEFDFVEQLVANRFPDYALTVIEAAKKQWKEADELLFPLEIRSLLSLSRQDEAERRVGALPDRKSAKYWSARLEIANSYFFNNKKKECSEIYDAFFQAFPKPTASLRKFYLNALKMRCYLLKQDGRFAEAADKSEDLLGLIDKQKDLASWCDEACEAAELRLRVAADMSPASRESALATAKKIVDQLLWNQSQQVAFGRAIAMRAHIELLKGNVAKAQMTIDDYKDQLMAIHKSMKEWDPDGSKGYLRLSPMPQCRYMMAEMMWKEVQAEMKKPKRDDERVKSLLYGEKRARDGKRNAAGAFNHAINVFLNFPESTWAVKAGKLADEIKAFTKKNYNVEPQVNISKEARERVIAEQFRVGHEKLAGGDYDGALKIFEEALVESPELKESVRAIEAMIGILMDQYHEAPEGKLRQWLRLKTDAIEGYLAERFGQAADRELMIAAGSAALRVANKEKTRRNFAAAEAIYASFVRCYPDHVAAGALAAQLSAEAFQKKQWEKVLFYGQLQLEAHPENDKAVGEWYKMAIAQGKLGRPNEELAYLKKYIELEPKVLVREQARMALGQMYQRRGLGMIAAAQTNAEATVQAELIKEGQLLVARGIQSYGTFIKVAEKVLKEGTATAEEQARYRTSMALASFMIADGFSRLTKPEDKLEQFRNRAVEGFEAFLKNYPDSEYAPRAYVKLGTLATLLGEVEKSKEAFSRLAKAFPNSDEAKNSKPKLARSLIEMGYEKEGASVYAEMLNTSGSYTARQFLAAGEALTDIRRWREANEAFEKARLLAGTNETWVIGKSQIGQARALYRQEQLAEAQDVLDKFFEAEEKRMTALNPEAQFLMVEVSSARGRRERDDALRAKYFNAAVAALGKVRQFWSRKGKDGQPLKAQWERDALDLLSADVKIRQMKAEEEMNLKDAAMKTRRRAAATLQKVIQSRGVSAQRPLESLKEEELANLEACYARMVPLFRDLHSKNGSEFVMRYGQEYLRLFPEGAARTEIQNCVNQAKADLGLSDATVAPTVETLAVASDEGAAAVEGATNQAPAVVSPAPAEASLSN